MRIPTIRDIFMALDSALEGRCEEFNVLAQKAIIMDKNTQVIIQVKVKLFVERMTLK
jgi:hypothetical protein